MTFLTSEPQQNLKMTFKGQNRFMSLPLADRVSFRKMSEMARVESGLPIANFKFVRFTSNERFALESLETFLKVSSVITGVIISFNKCKSVRRCQKLVSTKSNSTVATQKDLRL